MRLFLSCIICLALFCSELIMASPTRSNEVSKVQRQVIVEGSVFGIFGDLSSKSPSFTPTFEVPLVENQNYGWIIKIRSSLPKVKWREELSLPAVPETWGLSDKQENRTLTNDGRTLITEREVELENGLITNVWSVASGDPKGQYIIRVFIDGEVVGVFRFELK